MRKHGREAILLVALACACPHVAWPQEARATIGGRVTDPQGAIVPGADVMVVSDDSGIKQQTKTDTHGNWTVEFLLPGHYHFSIQAADFKKSECAGIEL